MNRNIQQTVKWNYSVVLDRIPHFYFNYSKHEVNMNKIVRPQPVIRRRRVSCLFMSSTSRSVSGQEYELCEMPPVWALHLAFLLWGLRNAGTIARRAIGGSGKRQYSH